MRANTFPGNAAAFLCAAGLTLVASFLPLSCGGSQPTSAELVVTFNPNPVMHFAPGEWLYRITVTETKGVGVYISSFESTRYSPSEIPLGSNERDAEEFQVWFLECGGSGTYIPGGQSRCTDVISFDGVNSGHTDWEFIGVDDFGNTVIGVGRIDFL